MKKQATLIASPFNTKKLNPKMIMQVDNEHPNGGYLAEIMSVTPSGMFAVISDGKDSWSIMSDRLQPIKFYLVADGLKIKDNDLVAYTFDADHVSKYANKTFVAEVRTIWKEKNEAGVLAEYGQDIVSLDVCRKVIATPDKISLGLKDIQSIIENKGNCSVEWEENQCDGCKARIPLDGTIHIKKDDPRDRFGIGCTANRYDRPKLINGKTIINL